MMQHREWRTRMPASSHAQTDAHTHTHARARTHAASDVAESSPALLRIRVVRHVPIISAVASSIASKDSYSDYEYPNAESSTVIPTIGTQKPRAVL